MLTPLWKRTYRFVGAVSLYFGLSVFFLFKLITSNGEAAQQDWAIPITNSAASSEAKSLFYSWAYNGFGGADLTGRWGFPFFQTLNAGLAPLGFTGGNEIKLIAVCLVALSGVTAYVLARSLKMRFSSSFLVGLFFMTTPIIFDWLMFGWYYYIIGYCLLPLMILTVKKFVETSDLRYALVNGIILAIVIQQPTFILIYPLLGFIFLLFETRFNLKAILRGVLFTGVSLAISLLSAMGFFFEYNNQGTLSFYTSNYYGIIFSQFTNLSSILNTVRIWGSTYNSQFEIYFPSSLKVLSFLPVFLGIAAFLWKPKNKRILFAATAYLFVLVTYTVYSNFHFFVYDLPYGALMEAPSIFLVPACLGLTLLIGYLTEEVTKKSFELPKGFRKKAFRVFPIVALLIIVGASVPWWIGQASGAQNSGAASKLDLYNIPQAYLNWNSVVNASDMYFTLNFPSDSYLQMNLSGFSGQYQGVNSAVYMQVNSLPYVSVSNGTLLLDSLMNGNVSQVAEPWGLDSIKYIVVYTNVQDAVYNTTAFLSLMSNQKGIVEVADLPDVVVYQDEYAEPVVYSLNATTEITYHDPTAYKIQAYSATPFNLTLNQVYAAGWVATINGNKLTTHMQDANGFNCWYINDTGKMTINLYYEPQTTYNIGMLIASGTLILTITYLIITGVRHKLHPKQESAHPELKLMNRKGNNHNASTKRGP